MLRLNCETASIAFESGTYVFELSAASNGLASLPDTVQLDAYVWETDLSAFAYKGCAPNCAWRAALHFWARSITSRWPKCFAESTYCAIQAYLTQARPQCSRQWPPGSR